MSDSIFLKKLALSDSSKLMVLANNSAISDDMISLPSPFKVQDAKALIERSRKENDIIMGVRESNSGHLCGVVMLRDIEITHLQAELSVWIGEKFWGKGYGSYAIQLMTNLGLQQNELNRIYAYCMLRNIASQRILEKSGFVREGLLRERVIKNNVFEDVYIYAKLRKDILSKK